MQYEQLTPSQNKKLTKIYYDLLNMANNWK